MAPIWIPYPAAVGQRHTIEGDNAANRNEGRIGIRPLLSHKCRHPRSRYTFSRRSAVKPIGRRLATGGCISWRMAARMAAMASRGW